MGLFCRTACRRSPFVKIVWLGLVLRPSERNFFKLKMENWKWKIENYGRAAGLHNAKHCFPTVFFIWQLLFVRTRFSPTKAKQLSDFEFGKLFLIYINFLLDYLIWQIVFFCICFGDWTFFAIHFKALERNLPSDSWPHTGHFILFTPPVCNCEIMPVNYSWKSKILQMLIC